MRKESTHYNVEPQIYIYVNSIFKNTTKQQKDKVKGKNSSEEWEILILLLVINKKARNVPEDLRHMSEYCFQSKLFVWHLHSTAP